MRSKINTQTAHSTNIKRPEKLVVSLLSFHMIASDVFSFTKESSKKTKGMEHVAMNKWIWLDG